jgi:uncharacterized oligopeptide transporter (OPT) family protein
LRPLNFLAGGEGTGSAKALGLAAGAGALFKLAMSGLRLVPNVLGIRLPRWQPTDRLCGIEPLPGITRCRLHRGPNVGTVTVAGGLLAWWLFIPIYHAFFALQDSVLAAKLAGVDAETAAGLIWTAKVRYIGVGAMLVGGGLWALWTLRHSLLSGIRSGLSVSSNQGIIDERERDLPMSFILVGIVLLYCRSLRCTASWWVATELPPRWPSSWSLLDTFSCGRSAGTWQVLLGPPE